MRRQPTYGESDWEKLGLLARQLLEEEIIDVERSRRESSETPTEPLAVALQERLCVHGYQVSYSTATTLLEQLSRMGFPPRKGDWGRRRLAVRPVVPKVPLKWRYGTPYRPNP